MMGMIQILTKIQMVMDDGSLYKVWWPFIKQLSEIRLGQSANRSNNKHPLNHFAIVD